MASVNFKKIKSRSEASRLIRHCDREMRAIDNHANKSIDPNKTINNLQLNYDKQETENRFLERIRALDETTNTNKRKDRVELFALEIPIPENIEIKEFSQRVVGMLRHKYGEENVINAYTHVDEIHDYMEHGEKKTSLAHIHCFVVPEIEGKLNAKKFSSRTAMKSLNKTIDRIALKYFNKTFLKYRTSDDLKQAKDKFGHSVEELKARTRTDEYELMAIKMAILDKVEMLDDKDKAYEVYKSVKSEIDGFSQTFALTKTTQNKEGDTR